MIINMDFKDFNTIVSIIKSMKSDIFYINGNTILGADSGFCIIKSVILPEPFPARIISTTTDLLEFISNSSEIGSKSISIGTDFGDISSDYDTLPNILPLYYNDFDVISRKISYINNYSEPCYTCSDMKSNEDFNAILAMRATDGISTLNIDNRFMITLYNNLLPINKADKVSLSIYDICGAQFISVFSIKKSKYTINVFMKCINL